MSGWSTFVRQATALCLLLAVALAVVLLTVTHQVKGLEEELGSLHESIADEQQTIHVLRAEFSFLADPERIRRLASAHLGLVPIEPTQLSSFAALDNNAPRKPNDGTIVRPRAGVRVASAERR
ncbi:MAG: cell division protein FtsL [Rhodospirillales bacterium]|nr:cell division protein FtsL [Rhodospirillales bacterium]